MFSVKWKKFQKVKKEKLNILIFLHFVGGFSAEEFPLSLSLSLSPTCAAQVDQGSSSPREWRASRLAAAACSSSKEGSKHGKHHSRVPLPSISFYFN